MFSKTRSGKITSNSTQSKMVTLGLQLLSGERLIGDFDSSVSLWDVLQHWQNENKLEPSLNINPNDVPICIYLRQELCGKKTLEEKKLSDLGITSGKTIIRYLTRQAGTIIEQAHVGGILAPPPKPLVLDTAILSMESNKEDTCKMESLEMDVDRNKLNDDSETISEEKMDIVDSTMDAKNSPVSEHQCDELENISMTTQKQEPFVKVDHHKALLECHFAHDKGTLDLLDERGVLIYSVDDSSTSSNLVSSTDQELSEDFFELTVDDLRNLMRDLRQQCNSMENEPLLTAEQRAARKEQRQKELLQRYPQTIIRIQFHDRLVLQIPFDSETKLSEVKQQLWNYLQIPREENDFYLYTSPPKSILDPSSTLLTSGLCPSSVVHIGCSSSNCQLKDEYRSRLSSPSAAMLEAARRIFPALNQESAEVIQQPTTEHFISSIEESQHKIPKRPSSSASKSVPKWFKMNK